MGIKQQPAGKLPPDHKFGIAFDTNKYRSQGMLSVVTVTLREDVMGMDESAFVNLCEHPLYRDLERYVLANPSRK